MKQIFDLALLIRGSQELQVVGAQGHVLCSEGGVFVGAGLQRRNFCSELVDR
ncbi:hypothetical protein [Nocardioides sp. LML1-1-1.1]|uniref:hypothetical protein n=1 Tax=Nocardioides sp. LML1-1-1.1 TaxID=3135248 RepID=UPI0034297CCA